MRLSPSKIAKVLRCPREYAFSYLMNIPEPKSKPLLIGTAFHAALDGKPADLAPLQALDSEYPWHACMRRMLAGHKAAMEAQPTEVAREIVYESEQIKIIADEIRMEKDGRFWLCENKSATLLDEKKKLILPNEIQMLAYTAHVKQVAEVAWQDPEAFAGVKYVTTLKPAERRKKNEGLDEFGERLTSSTVVWDFKADLFKDSVARWAIMVEFITRRISEIEIEFHKAKSVDPLPCNTASCVRFGNWCPYAHLCHGADFDGQ